MAERYSSRSDSPVLRGNAPKVKTDARKKQSETTAVSDNADADDTAKYCDEFKARVKRAAGGRVVSADSDFEYRLSDSLSDFLEKADAFGFHNFKTAVMPKSWCVEFNQFLQANEYRVSQGIVAYGKIPLDWLDKRDKEDPLPGVGSITRRKDADPAADTSWTKDASDKMLERLAEAEYRLVLNKEGDIPSNYYFWLSVFDALKLVREYQASRGMK